MKLGKSLTTILVSVGCALGASGVTAQRVTGSIAQQAKMTESTVAGAEVALRSLSAGGSEGIAVQSILIGDRARIGGNVTQMVEMNKSNVFVGKNGSVQSIRIGM